MVEPTIGVGGLIVAGAKWSWAAVEKLIDVLRKRKLDAEMKVLVDQLWRELLKGDAADFRMIQHGLTVLDKAGYVTRDAMELRERFAGAQKPRKPGKKKAPRKVTKRKGTKATKRKPAKARKAPRRAAPKKRAK